LVLFGQGHIAEEAEANGHQQEKWSHFVSSVSPRCVDGPEGNSALVLGTQFVWFGRCCFVDWMS
jgi:hypothetical protein